LAYGITEEGLGDNTLFNSTHHADGVLGVYGHFLGVNWVWAVGVLAFHVIYSIGLPILLLGLALPEIRGRSLLADRGLVIAFGTLIASTGTETAIVYGAFRFWMGLPLLAGSLVAISALVLAGRRAPRDLWRPESTHPSISSFRAALLGFSVFPILFLLEYGVGSYEVPAALVILVELVVLASLLEILRRSIGRTGNERRLVDLALGLVLWQSFFGVLLTLGLPYTLPLIALVLVFFVRLRRAYPEPATDRPSKESAGPPPGALLGRS
jgi:hypothetical protein